MQYGLSHERITDMFYSLANEVFGYFNYAGPMPDFAVKKFSIFEPDVGVTNFHTEQDRWLPTKYAQSVHMNIECAEGLYEDEVIGVHLHELAHVVAGLHAGHDDEWLWRCLEIGGVSEPFFIPRRVEGLPYIYRDRWDELLASGRTPTYGYL